MSTRTVTLLVYSCSNDGINEAYIQEAKRVANFDPLVDTFQVAFVVIGESSDLPVSSEQVVQDAEYSRLLLEEQQIASIPCLLVKQCSGENEVTVLPRIQAPESDQAVTEGHFSAAVEAYNEFNLYKAVSSFELALQCDPHHKKSLFNLASIMHMLDYPTLAVGFITRLLLLDGDDTIAHSFLWALNSTGKCTGAAIAAYTQLAANGDLDAITKLAALTNTGPNATRGDPVYAERIYDEMAAKFENKLVDCLGYRGPWLMRDLLEGLVTSASNVDTNSVSDNDGASGTASVSVGDTSASIATSVHAENDRTLSMVPAVYFRPQGAWRILDVGCGSGLCGKVFDQYVRTIHTTTSTTTAGDNTTPNQEMNCTPDTTDTAAVAGATRDNLPISAVPYTTGGLMAGIDVSGKILEIARNTGKYDCTEKYDLCEALRVLDCTKITNTTTTTDTRDPAHFVAGSGKRTGLDMVIAADTFIYVGALGEVFSLVRNVLRDAVPDTSSTGKESGASDGNGDGDGAYGGLFMFSTEDLETSPMRVEHSIITTTSSTTAITSNTSNTDTALVDSAVTDYDLTGAVPGWGGQLLKSARFAHSDGYIRALCEKYLFRVLVHEKIVLRTEETIPLPGNIYFLQKMV